MKQWIARAISLCVVGPIAAMIASGVVAPDGSHSTTFLTSSSMGSGGIALAIVLGLVLVMGVCFGRLIDRREGLLNIAFVLGWVAWTMGRMGEVYRISPESGTLIALAIEGLVVSCAVLLALVLMTNPSKGMVHGHSDDISRFDVGYLKGALCTKAGIASMLAAFAGALVISTVWGQNDLPGQSVGVGFFAGIGAGLAGTLAATSINKSGHSIKPTAFAPVIVGVMLCSVLTPLIGIIKPGSGGLLELVMAADLPGYLIVSPMAWTMGALLGVPMGHSWVEHSVQQAGATQGAPA